MSTINYHDHTDAFVKRVEHMIRQKQASVPLPVWMTTIVKNDSNQFFWTFWPKKDLTIVSSLLIRCDPFKKPHDYQLSVITQTERSLLYSNIVKKEITQIFNDNLSKIIDPVTVISENNLSFNRYLVFLLNDNWINVFINDLHPWLEIIKILADNLPNEMATIFSQSTF